MKNIHFNPGFAIIYGHIFQYSELIFYSFLFIVTLSLFVLYFILALKDKKSKDESRKLLQKLLKPISDLISKINYQSSDFTDKNQIILINSLVKKLNEIKDSINGKNNDYSHYDYSALKNCFDNAIICLDEIKNGKLLKSVKISKILNYEPDLESSFSINFGELISFNDDFALELIDNYLDTGTPNPCLDENFDAHNDNSESDSNVAIIAASLFSSIGH